MLVTLENFIKRAVIDNRQRDITSLTLYGDDENRPFQIEMEGNCLQDIAGCKVEFENQLFAGRDQGPWDFLDKLKDSCKQWHLGDFTLSARRPEQNNRAYLSNNLSLEFFAETHIRLLIESDFYTYKLTPPTWKQEWWDDAAQQYQNTSRLRDHIQYSIEHQLQRLKSNPDGFPRSDWDDILNKAEISVTIANSLKGKYPTLQSELENLAFIFDLDHVQQMLADQSSNLDFRSTIELPVLELFEYLSTEHDAIVKEAMQHPLFMSTSCLTESSFNKLGDTLSGKLLTTVQLNELRLQYSQIVSRILASIIMAEQAGQYSVELISKRISLIRRDMVSLIKSLTKRHKVIQEFKEQALILIESLDDFAKALSHH